MSDMQKSHGSEVFLSEEMQKFEKSNFFKAFSALLTGSLSNKLIFQLKIDRKYQFFKHIYICNKCIGGISIISVNY